MIKRLILVAALAVAALSAAWADRPTRLANLIQMPISGGGTTPTVVAHTMQSCPGNCTSEAVTLAAYQTNLPFFVFVFYCDTTSCIAMSSGGPTITGVTDTAGDTCTAVSGASHVTVGEHNALIGFKCSGGTNPGSNTITISCSNGTGTCAFVSGFVAQFSVVSGTAELGNAAATESGTSITPTLSGTTTANNEVIFALCASGDVITMSGTNLDTNSGFQSSSWSLISTSGSSGSISCGTGSTQSIGGIIAAMK